VTGHVALVVGATGVTGAPLCEELLRQGWTVYAVSRRMPVLRSPSESRRLIHLPIDLADAGAIHDGLAAHKDITHVFYCANAPTQELRQAMISHLLDALEHAAGFRSINFIQGMKYYGCHLGPFSTPARETDPRVAGCDFYYTEEDMLVRRQQGAAWSWTVLRPHSVCGYSAGNPVNVAAALAIYGAIQRERGAPFSFPGTPASFNTRFQVMDAGLLARAAIHVSTKDACANTAFNINNGDAFRWSDLWPELAGAFGLEPAPPDGSHPMQFFAQHESTWRGLAGKHGLREFPYDRLPRWCLGEYKEPNGRLNCEYDLFADTTRLRQSGFAETVDNRDMFLRIFADLRAERMIR
jgi:nucleoside-diphosphate-sugar epimerase